MAPSVESSLPSTKIRSSSQHRQQSPASSTTSRTKGRRAMTDLEEPKEKKAPKTYGSQGSQDIFEFHGDSDVEVRVRKRRKKVGIMNRKECDIQDNHASPCANTPPGSQIKESAGRDQEILPNNTMAPPPSLKPASDPQSQYSFSSTIPFSTAAETTRETTSLSREMNLEDPETFDMTSTVRRASTFAKSSQAQNNGERVIAECSTTASSNPDPGVGHVSSRDARRTSSSASTSAHERTTATENATRMTVSPSSSPSVIGRNYIAAQSDFQTAGSTDPVVLLPENPQLCDDQDELSLSALDKDAASNSVAVSRKTQKRDNAINHKKNDELSSDDITIDLPKEQYKARPSKSRSGRGAEEIFVPEDFSKRPEALLKSKPKAKRRKTSAVQEFLPKEDDKTDEEKNSTRSIHESQNMGVTEALPSNGQERLFLEASEANDTTDETTAKHPSPKKQRGRPRKATKETSEEDTCGPGQDDTEPEKPLPNLPAAKTPKKRGRKAKAAPEIIDEQANDDDSDSISNAANNCEKIPPSKIPDDKKNKTPLNDTPSPEQAPPLESSEPITLPQAPPPPPPQQPPQTPQKQPQAQTPQKGPDKHSPISSAKVAYRVGLSKRARIEPLLRIVRK